MADRQPGHLDQIKQTNAGVIYRLIDQAGPVSRIDLSRLTQLAPASITKLAREMMRAGLIRETQIAAAAGRGRPAVGLVVETDRWRYLAARITRGQVCLTLFDLACQGQRSAMYPLEGDGAALAEQVLGCVRRFCDGLAGWSLLAVSVTLPGVVDSESGIVRRMAFYSVQDMPLGEVLAQGLGVPVFVQHDISGWAMTELLIGASRGARDVVQLVIADQVGAAVITEGRLLHGGSSSLVEIGHLPVSGAGERCGCGLRGCLQTMISTQAVLARWQVLRGLSDAPLTVERLCDAALQGEALAGQLLADVARHAGQVLAIMVNLFNPQKILIGSPFNQAGALWFDAISREIRQQALPLYSQHIMVESTHFSCQDTIVGSAIVKDAMYDGRLLLPLLQRLSPQARQGGRTK